nr:DNA helicase [Rhodospirillales bacterium]
VLRAARRALREEMPRRVARLEAAVDDAFAWLPSQRIAWEGTPIARLRPGATALRPLVEVLDSEFLDSGARERVRQRLQRYIDAEVRDVLAPLFAAAEVAERESALRGPMHRLTEGLGVAPQAEDAAAPALRSRLKAMGVRVGRRGLFLPALLKPRPAARRAALWALRRGEPVPSLPAPGLVAMAPPEDWPVGFATALGWVAAGPMLVRLDIAERVGAELTWNSRRGPVPVPADLASRLSVRAELLPAVLHGLGFRLFPAAPLAQEQFGPPAPAMMAPQRRPAATPPRHPAPRQDGPFAALAALRP